MNKFVLLSLAFFTLSFTGFSQDTAEKKLGWSTGAIVTLNTSHTSLTNWVAGGQNSMSLNTFMNAHLNYLAETSSWENTLDLGYGLIKQGKQDFIKSDDKIEFNSKFGKHISEKLNYSGLLNFKSQMTAGYASAADNSVISDLMSPGYLLASIGIDYKPIEGVSIFIGPLSGKATFVNHPDLVALGSFGLAPGKKVRTELGAYIRTQHTGEIMKNLSVQNKLDLFSNYLNQPQFIDVNWELLLLFKFNSFLTASINTQLIYDHDIEIGKDTSGDGLLDDFGPRIQFKEIVGLGLTFSF